MAKAPEKRDPWVPLRQSIPYSERVNSVSLLAECLFVRLLALVDDQSAFDAEPDPLCRQAFPKRRVSVTHTARARDELVTAGLIRLYGDGRYLAIINPKRFNRSDVKPDIRYPPPPTEDVESGPNTARNRPESGPSYVYEEVEVKEQQKKPLSPSGDGYSPGFDAFWKAYTCRATRKGGKQDCWKFWKQEKLEPLAEDILACVEAAKKSRDWKKDNKQYMPGPLPWLRKKAWLTEDFAKDAADGAAPAFVPQMRGPSRDEIWSRLANTERGLWTEQARLLLADRAPPKGRDAWPRPVIVEKGKEMWWQDRLGAAGKE